jgi:hypothetical protein
LDRAQQIESRTTLSLCAVAARFPKWIAHSASLYVFLQRLLASKKTCYAWSVAGVAGVCAEFEMGSY